MLGIAATAFILLIILVLSFNSQQNPVDIAKFSPTPTPKLIPGQDYVQGQINVKFKKGMTDPEINNHLTKYNARIQSTISGINVKVVEVPRGQEKSIQDQLTKDGIVQYAEYDHITRLQFIPNDSEFSKQWGLKNTGQSIQGQTGTPNADIKVEKAWDRTKGAGIKVAVIDNGLDFGHGEFVGKVVGQKVFIENSFTNGKHGTHVAGIIAAGANNGPGISGVCPECQLLIAKTDGENANQAEVSDEASAITWAADNGANVINMSFGDKYNSQTLGEAVAYAWNKGAVLVAGAGNCGNPNNAKFCNGVQGLMYPAAYPNVVSVAATDNRDQKAGFSSYGSWVDVAAPGNEIFSTVFGGYEYMSGTSMASPMVAGVVALIRAANPNFSNQQVVDRVLSTADKIPGTGSFWQHGRVNAEAALNQKPQGAVDDLTCDKVRGWAFDPDEPGKSISVHVYINGVFGTLGAEGYDLGPTSVDRPDVNSVKGITGIHGFDWPLPAKYRDGKAHDIFVYAIDSQGGNNPEIRHGNTGICQQSSNPNPTATVGPTQTPIIQNPTTGPNPTNPVPTYVCGGSPNSICGTPTPTPTGHIINPTQVITQPPGLTGEPSISPPVNPNPTDPCLNPRDPGFIQQILNWVQSLRQQINDFIQSILGNPTAPTPAPPTITPPCITP